MRGCIREYFLPVHSLEVSVVIVNHPDNITMVGINSSHVVYHEPTCLYH